MRKLLIFALCIAPIAMIAQLKPIGTWSDHLPYNLGTAISTNGTIVYAATQSGLFTYNTDDNSIRKFSKVNLLNDVEITKIAYAFDSKTIVIAYVNGNIDLIKENSIVNIPFLKLSNENKKINEINVINNIAYLSTDYGISLIDLSKNEIADSYKYGPNGVDIKTNSSVRFNNNIYAATENGIYSGAISSNLLDFNNWSKLSFKATSTIKKIQLFNNQLVMVTRDDGSSKDSVYTFNGNNFQLVPELSGMDFKSFELINPNSCIFNTHETSYFLNSNLQIKHQLNHNINGFVGSVLVGNRYFILNNQAPLIEYDTSSNTIISTIRPNGPAGKNIFDMDASNGILWTANGGHDFAYNNTYSNAEIYRYDGQNWKNYITYNPPSLTGKFDVLAVTANPAIADDVYFGTWGTGIVRFNQNLPFISYTDTNSSLKVRQALAQFNWIGAGEGSFDEEGNFWTTNTYQVNALSVRKANGSWKSFDLSNVITSDETAIFDIEVDQNGYKWITLPKDNAIVVFDDNRTIDDISDDQSIKLTPSVTNGSIPGARGIKLEVDRDGLIWIGTSDGIAVHFNPGAIFDGDLDFDRIIFFDGENNEILLQNSVVKEITVDGFNRKWVSVENSGVLLISADGKETILEFNTENSPLPSNQVDAITIDEISGEVYMATDKGLVSYRGEAIGGNKNLTSVKVFPNPVEPEYTGNIAISGLMDNSTIKVTDVHGTLVREIKSQGGQALWDGNNFSGNRVSSGIYLVFISAEDNDSDLKTEIGKIMIIN